MPWKRLTVIVGALLLGGFMLLDGGRALLVGDYFTPRSGPYAGQLGPWAALVSRVGVAPRGTLMKVIFVALGASWLLALASYIRRPLEGRSALPVLALASMWYLPVGTILSVIILAMLAPHRPRARRGKEDASPAESGRPGSPPR